MMKMLKAGMTAALLLGTVAMGICQEVSDQKKPESQEATVETKISQEGKPVEVATKEQEADIRKLIEQLVFVPFSEPATVDSAESGDKPADPFAPTGSAETIEENRRRAAACQDAFQQLTAYKDLAFSFMAEHLEDKRRSVDFHGHWKRTDVGAACYWNIRYQLEDHSFYGYSRKGRDGQSHVRPCYQDPGLLPYDGIKQWLMENAALSYTGKQIKCLRWQLEEEKKIGLWNPEDYFEHILPLEIQILQRRGEQGEEVGTELERLRKIQKEKLPDSIPPELLPAGASGRD